VKDLLHTGLQRHSRRRLRDPVNDIRYSESPRPFLLGNIHRSDRPGEVRPRRHAIPQDVQAVLRPLLELLDRYTVGPSRPAFPLHLQPRIPQQPLGDVIRLALQPRLMHALPSFRLNAPMSQDSPAPWLRPRCDTREVHSYYGRVRRRTRRRYSAPHGFCRSESFLSPPVSRQRFPDAPSHVP
jgi:hypothetical protein